MKKILVANRGEIACRIIKTARRMNMETVSIFSDADKTSMHTKMADKAIHIGDSVPSASYLCMEKIVESALKTNCQAIHPGYGFLSENAPFADMCKEANLVFIGPPSNAIRDMGMKSLSKKIMSDAGVPIIAGYHGNDNSDEKLMNEAKKIGFPIMIKAVFGGGGKGMRLCLSESAFLEKLSSARNEAMKSFGDSKMIIERYVEKPRHVESQIFADNFGNCVYISERDPGLRDDTREKIGKTAVKAALAVNYSGAGTVEFIMDDKENFYFMEMNTRLQVEHPVTEMITGLDLVEWQIRVSRGEKLPIINQENIKHSGHSIEARIYAEDTKNNFMPSPGVIKDLMFTVNENVRIDSGIVKGDEISVFYDPMISKIIAKGSNRAEANSNLITALKDYEIRGVKTNRDFLLSILEHEKFTPENLHTGFIDSLLVDPNNDSISKGKDELSIKKAEEYARVVCAHFINQFLSTNQVYGSLRINQNSTHVVNFNQQEESITATIETIGGKRNEFSINIKIKDSDTSHTMKATLLEDVGNKYLVKINDCSSVVDYIEQESNESILCHTNEFGLKRYSIIPESIDDIQLDCDVDSEDLQDVFSPLPGTIEQVFVKPGAIVKKGQKLMILTAMKMEHILKATMDGTVEKVFCNVGEIVGNKQIVLKITE